MVSTYIINTLLIIAAAEPTLILEITMNRFKEFAGHHQHTFPADKQIPKVTWWRGQDIDYPRDPRDSNKFAKRTHNRKSRAWFRREDSKL